MYLFVAKLDGFKLHFLELTILKPLKCIKFHVLIYLPILRISDNDVK